MMKRSSIVLIISAAVLIGLLALLYIFVVRPRLAPIEIPEPPAPTVIEEPALPTEKNAVLNLYFNSPLELRGISRIELTLLKAKLVMNDELDFIAFEGAERIMSQKDVVQKVFSERIFHGKLESLQISLGPTAKIIYSDSRTETVFLPVRELLVALDTEVPLSQTLNVMISLPASTALGERNGITTLKLPRSMEAETHVLTSIFFDPRSRGEIYSVPNANIADAIKSDTGLDITPRPGQSGSSGFAAPTEAPVQ